MASIQRKAIFITGAGSGIGRATARRFADSGWFVGLADIDQAGLDETARLLGDGACSRHRMDVRDREAWRTSLAEFAQRSGGRLDVLFNNAGVGRGGLFEDMAEADHDLLVDINLKGIIKGAEAGLPYLRATPGSCLLNTSSFYSLYGTPGAAVYSATKFAVRGFTESLNNEWRRHGVRVRSLAPSFVDTPMLDSMTAGSTLNARENVLRLGLAFTPVEAVAQAAWDAVHGKRVHSLIGKGARQLAFLAQWAPWLLERRFARA